MILFYSSIFLGFGFIKIRGISISYWIGRLVAQSFLFFSRVSVKIELAPGVCLSKMIESKNILACNHASSYDTFVLQAWFPHPIQFVIKRELLMIPFFGWGLWILGCIPINRKNKTQSKEKLKTITHKLPQGSYTVIFPEGSRTSTGEIQPFKSGVIRMYQEKNDVTIIPVGIVGSYKVLSKNSWKLIPGEIVIRIGHPISPNELPQDLEKATKTLENIVKTLCK